MKKLLVLSLAAWPLASYGAVPEEIFESLKNRPAKYEVTGTVCEQVVKLQMEREYPSPRFRTETGISYGSSQRTIGELDVVVFDERNAAVAVSEVKCWKNFGGGLRKARDQGKRFIASIGSGSSLQFTDSEGHQHGVRDFASIRSVMAYGPAGAKSSGYDGELPYSLEDLMAARQLLLSCQKRGNCPLP